MTEGKQAYFDACEAYLKEYSIGDLRNYGRSIGVSRPTAKNKAQLISEILGVYTGEIAAIEISRQGAPVKNSHVDARIAEKMASLKEQYFPTVTIDYPERDLIKEMQDAWDNRPMIHLADPAEEERGFISERICRGQVDRIDGLPCVLPLDCAEQENPVFLPKEIIEEKDLREGDRIVYQTRTNPKTGITTVAVVLTVNDLWTETPPVRPHFDECIAVTPSSPLRVCGKGEASAAVKFVEWFAPLFKGQRGCLISSPKAGKTRLLFELAKATATWNTDVETFVLLVDQPPETVGEFYRNFDKTHLFYTTYEDDPKRQVLMADFLLKRAKRMVEKGKDVCLFIDSLTALAHAFNDTEESSGGKTLSCGLEIKTVRYIKKYFGAARRIEQGGSLTIFGTVSAQTGNPFDDVVCAEYAAQANYELRLSNELALRRVYPAIDFTLSSTKTSRNFASEQEEDFEFFLYNEALLKLGAEELIKRLSQAKSYGDFVSLVEQALQA